MKNINLLISIALLFLSVHLLEAKPEACKPSGRVKGRKPPPDYCNEDDDICCIPGRYYTLYECSPRTTKAVLSLTGFEKGGDGYGPSTCDNKYHSNHKPVVAVSTGWYSGGSRCGKNITISGNGRSVNAIVVDECDSSVGCNAKTYYLPPCPNNIVDASQAVWEALGVPINDWGEMAVTWSDA